MPFFDLKQADLERYVSSTIDPADFDSFWSDTLAEAQSFPLAVTFAPVDTGLALVDVYDVSFAGFRGQPVRGWYMAPKSGGNGTTVIKYLGYGGGRAFPHEHLLWAACGRALFVMDTRGQGSSWSRGDTADPDGSDPAHPGFMTRGILDKANYYYRRVFTDGVRAIAAVKSRAETDPGRIALVGGSQGGGITIAVAGLVGTEVAAAMPDVPFLCDFPRAIGLTTRDPYGEIVRYLAVHRSHIEQAFETLTYFDGVNFARRARAAALFSVAHMDDVCPPSTVYGAYNVWGGDKSIEAYTFNNHEGGGPFQERAQLKWLTAQGL